MFQIISLKLKDFFTPPRIIFIVNLLLACLLIWTVGFAVARIIDQTVLDVPFQPAKFRINTQTGLDRSKDISEFQSIIDNNVFNAEIGDKVIEAVVEAKPAAPGISLQQIAANLVLIGITKRTGQYSLCIIKDKKNRSEDLFAINDKLFDTEAIVYRIIATPGKEHVIIKLNNETATITYSEEEPKESAPNRASASSRKGSDKESESDVESEYSTDGKNFYISSEEVDSELNNFAHLLNQARMVPFFKNGKHQGYQVKAIDKGSLYEKLGLKNSDIIEEINGEPLDSMEKVMDLFKRLRNEREFDVKINRKGVSQHLNYYIN